MAEGAILTAMPLRGYGSRITDLTPERRCDEVATEEVAAMSGRSGVGRCSGGIGGARVVRRKNTTVFPNRRNRMSLHG